MRISMRLATALLCVGILSIPFTAYAAHETPTATMTATATATATSTATATNTPTATSTATATATMTATATSTATSTPVSSPALTTISSAAAGTTINVSWSNVSNPTTLDWIGLFQPGATNHAFLSWVYESGSQAAPGSAMSSGTTSFPLPANLVPGAYELRLFAANDFGVLAVTSLNVTAAQTATPTLQATSTAVPTSTATSVPPTITSTAVAASSSPTTTPAGDWRDIEVPEPEGDRQENHGWFVSWIARFAQLVDDVRHGIVVSFFAHSDMGKDKDRDDAKRATGPTTQGTATTAPTSTAAPTVTSTVVSTATATPTATTTAQTTATVTATATASTNEVVGRDHGKADKKADTADESTDPDNGKKATSSSDDGKPVSSDSDKKANDNKASSSDKTAEDTKAMSQDESDTSKTPKDRGKSPSTDEKVLPKEDGSSDLKNNAKKSASGGNSINTVRGVELKEQGGNRNAKAKDQ